MNTSMSIGGAAKLTGMSCDTLRFYERSGLLKPDRLTGGKRIYRDRDMLLLRFIARMRATEMPVDDIRRYLDLAALGDSTMQERRAILEAHAITTSLRLQDCERALETIRFKLAHFDVISRGEAVPDTGCADPRTVSRSSLREKPRETRI